MRFPTKCASLLSRLSRCVATFGAGVFLSIFFALQVLAQTQNPGTGGTQRPGSGGTQGTAFGGFKNPLAFDSLDAFLVALLNVIITIGFPFIVLAVVYSGFLFVKAQGNETELATAKKAFLWVVIGSLIVLGAQALSLAIKGTTDQLRGQNSGVVTMLV